MNKSGFTLNTRDFDIKFPKITQKRIPEDAAQAIFQVAAIVLKDAITEEPTAPKNKGTLRRSQKIERPKVEHGAISIEIGFNTEYAAKLHEAPSNWNWSEPGSGPKFLEAKLSRNREKYMRETAERMRRKAR